ncbi:hypothetical protein OIO90_002984 [Microbotryomycetes sp. JL221]|nr:hypothetical protein OIO90_002984 [Microbotryomycetes sp. JL221]
MANYFGAHHGTQTRIGDFRPSLSPFLKNYQGVIDSCNPANHLQVLDKHNTRTRQSNSASFADSLSIAGSSTPPLSPAESFASLYPIPPHLSPAVSPASSPRSSTSPSLHPAPPTPTAEDGTHAGHDLPETHVMGKLVVKVVQARNLKVDSDKAKPYILLQYDRTDSVSREFGAPPPLPRPAETKRNGLKRLGPKIRSNAVNGFTSIATSTSTTTTTTTTTTSSKTSDQPKTTFRRVGPLKRTTSFPAAGPSSVNESSQQQDSSSSFGPRLVSDATPQGDSKEIGTASAPIWNHEATFDVVAPGRTILLCVYDKLAPQGTPNSNATAVTMPAHGFLGACVFEPPLSAEVGQDGQGLDLWIPLVCALDLENPVWGEVRVRILFEALPSRPKLAVEDFQVLRRIGQGSFGQVFRVRKKDTKRIYAMKVISKNNIVNKSALAQVLAERQVLARTNACPFLVGLKFSFQSPTDLFFVIDYKSGGELFTHLQRDGGRFEEAKVQFYTAEIILALDYLHSEGIVYRDLKPENCLLDGSGHVVLCDFGLSKLLDDPVNGRTRTLCGTTAFCAPEVLLDVGYGYSCDWWSLGCVLFEMCYGWSPFYAENQIDEYERILNAEIKIPSKKGYSDACRDLQLRLLTREPSERICANGGSSEIKAHAFFASIDWLRLSNRQVSPPWKPPTHADDDLECCEQGRSAEWMFGDGSSCWSTPCASRRGSGEWVVEMDKEGGLFRDFTYVSGAGHEKRRSSFNGTSLVRSNHESLLPFVQRLGYAPSSLSLAQEAV